MDLKFCLTVFFAGLIGAFTVDVLIPWWKGRRKR